MTRDSGLCSTSRRLNVNTLQVTVVLSLAYPVQADRVS